MRLLLILLLLFSSAFAADPSLEGDANIEVNGDGALAFTSSEADGATAVAFDFDTTNALSTSGAKLFSLSNNATEIISLDKDGYVILPSTGQDFKVYTTNGSNQLINVDSNAGNSIVAIGLNANITSFVNGAVAVGFASEANRGATALGVSTTASGYTSVAIGYHATASKNGSIAITGGNYNGAKATHYAGLAISGEEYATDGDNQFLLWQPSATTADATPAPLYMDEDGAANRMDVASGKLYAFEAHIVGVQSDGSDASYFVRRGIIANVGGTTALIGSVITSGTDIESNASTDVAITADDTNDALAITVTGIAAETWRWSANVFVKDITFGT